MRRILISILSGIVLVAIVIGVLPAAAAEPPEVVAAATLDSDSTIAKAGKPLTFTIAATDTDSNSLIYSASNLPPGATFDPLTRTFSWTPGYDQAGIYPNVHFEVSDGELTDSEDITITVINVDRPPVLDFIGDQLANEEELIEFAIKANDPDNDLLTYTATNLPQGAAFDSQTRTFSWTPGFGQRGSYPGIRFEVSDDELGDYEDIAINVQAITVKIPEEAIFSVNSLRVRPGKVNANKQVRISVLATNSGTAAGSYEVTLRINGVIEDNRIVTLSAGATEEVEFVTTKDIAGVYVVDVNGLSGSFEVREEENKGHGQKPSSKSILYKTLGWIRTLLQEGGDA